MAVYELSVMSEAFTQDDLTREDTFGLEKAVQKISELPGVTHTGTDDVWATFRCEDQTNYNAVFETVAKNGDVVVYHAEYSDKFVSIALEKFADEL
ncbi:hypothetical protein OSG_eHP4_00080 [environmental Halophage eHP-4]|nr:hypothetical protein OSG_eHP4_00080 [environmental Halophage eHP-4]